MKIEVKNFGKIKQGQIDLDKRVTVFVGYNNSGKTYMSQLLWALNTDHNLNDFVFRGMRAFSTQLSPSESFTFTKAYVDKFISLYVSTIEYEILPELFNVAKTYFYKDNFSIELQQGYLLETIKKAPFSLVVINKDNLVDYYHFKKEADSLQVSIEKKQYDKPVILEDFFKDKTHQSNAYAGDTLSTEAFNKNIYEIMIVRFLENKRTAPFFLPANRVFYPSFYKYIYSLAKEEIELIYNNIKNGFNEESISPIVALSKRPYTGAMDDLIKKFYTLKSDAKTNEANIGLLNDLKELIGGDIIVKNSEVKGPIEFYLQLADGKELDMYMSSSSANQLTTLYLYLKYWAQPTNNYLIIDEPEENLHPENQIKLVNILMKFADRGNKVLITTHSPLITDHVNNYANLSYLNEAGTDTGKLLAEGNFNMASVSNIKHADYGVYFFNGDSIKEYAMGDYGAYFKDFQQAEDKVKDISNILKENIYNNIHSNAKE